MGWKNWPGWLKGILFVLIFYVVFTIIFLGGSLTCKGVECAGALIFFFLFMILIGISPILLGLGALFGHILSKPKKEAFNKKNRFENNSSEKKRVWFDWPGWVKAIIFLLVIYLINLILFLFLKTNNTAYSVFYDIITAILMPIFALIIVIYGIISFIIWVYGKRKSRRNK